MTGEESLLKMTLFNVIALDGSRVCAMRQDRRWELKIERTDAGVRVFIAPDNSTDGPWRTVR